MIYETFTLRCDACSKAYREQFDTIKDLLEYSKEDGWDEVQVPNKSHWNMCPKCKEEYALDKTTEYRETNT